MHGSRGFWSFNTKSERFEKGATTRRRGGDRTKQSYQGGQIKYVSSRRLGGATTRREVGLVFRQTTDAGANLATCYPHSRMPSCSCTLPALILLLFWKRRERHERRTCWLCTPSSFTIWRWPARTLSRGDSIAASPAVSRRWHERVSVLERVREGYLYWRLCGRWVIKRCEWRRWLML